MDKECLQKTLVNIGIGCDDKQLNLLESYMDYILSVNENINLTAITDKESFREKMIYDSALPLLIEDFSNKDVLDVGTGAGFPGFVISVLSSANVTMMDSTNKKLEVINGFKDKKSNTINARIEEYGKKNRNKFDIVIARAVAPLNILLEICTPLVKVNGTFIAMKSQEYEKEISDCGAALKKLNLKIVRIDEEILPSGDERANILFKKLDNTPNKYPRLYKDIKDKPLRWKLFL